MMGTAALAARNGPNYGTIFNRRVERITLADNELALSRRRSHVLGLLDGTPAFPLWAVLFER